MNLLITDVTLFCNDADGRIAMDQAVCIKGTRVFAIGPSAELRKKFPEAKLIEGHGRLLMPGFINAHMHFYGTFARGIALRKTPQNFHEILKELWWRLDSALDLESVYYSALVQVISAVKHGVTAIIDHHASPNAIAGSLDKIEEALALLGLRGVLCYEISDRDGPEKSRLGFEENRRYIARCRNEKAASPDSLFDGMVGLHASFTLTDESLQSAAELAATARTGCHIHMLEDKVDRVITGDEYGVGVVARLKDAGVLSQRSIAAHGIWLDDREIDFLAETDTIVVHNPQSNMNNAVGRADIFKMLGKNILLGLGSDGMSADIKSDVRAANLLHKHDLGNSNCGWDEVPQMLLRNNKEIYKRLTGRQVGEISPGSLADVILLDYWPPTPMQSENFWGHFLFGIADAPVDTTIVNGRVIMHNKEIAGLDENGIAAHARECAERVWKRFADS